MIPISQIRRTTRLLALLLILCGAGWAQSLGEQARELRKSNPPRPAHEITEDDLPRQDSMLSSESCPLPQHVISTTACEVSLHPERFDGQLVSIRGRVHVADNTMDLRDNGCGGVLVVHSEDVGGRDRQGYRTCHGPRFRQMNQLVNGTEAVEQVHGRMCSPRCSVHPDIEATMLGRVQVNPHPESAGASRENAGFGFGNEYRVRVVLFSVKEFKETK